MKKTTVTLVLLLAAWPALAGVIEGRVIEVLDGATLTVLAREGASIHRIRLAGIDAPGKEKAIGGSSRESLRRMARGKTVRVETNAIDPRGLLVGNVEIHRTPKDCNNQPCPTLDPALSQLAAGLAVIDKKNLSHQTPAAQKLYLAAQAQAKANRLGVWRETSTQSAAHNAPPSPPKR
jgi:micrococcal nuclease